MAYDGNEKASQKWSDLFAKRAAPGREGWFFAIDNPHLRRRIHDTYMGGYDPMHWLRARMGWEPRAAAAPIPRALEIGCGAGDLALGLMATGWFGHLDAFDVAEGAVASGKARAEAAGLAGLHFSVADGNTIVLQPGSYDFIYASHSLHHITDLEHLCAQCAAALRPGGVMFASDYVGPSRMQYSDRHLALMNEMLARLPPEKRLDNMHGFQEKLLIQRTPLEVFEMYDPSEAPRSAEILQVLGQFFDLQVQHYGMELTYEVLLGIVHNFDPDDAADNALMDRLFELDRAAAGTRGVDQLFANLIARPRVGTRPVAVPVPVTVPVLVSVPVSAPVSVPGPAASAVAGLPGPGRSARPDVPALVGGQGGTDVLPAAGMVAGLVAGLEGWLAPDAADLTVRLCRFQASLGLQTGVLELGVYRGKYLALLAAAHDGAGLPVVGVDMFIERIGEPIPVEHVAHFIGLIVDNVRRVAPNAAPVVLAADTRALDAAGLLGHCAAGYSFVSVDAGHAADDVVHDLTLAASVLSAGGIVALDDAFYGPLPGVTEGLFRWLGAAGGGLAAFAHCGRKLLLCRPEMHGTWLAYAGWLLTQEAEAGYLAQSAELARRAAAVGFRPLVAGREIVAFGDVVPG